MANDAIQSWCEEDYIISPYIAEFINTLTNIPYCKFNQTSQSPSKNTSTYLIDEQFLVILALHGLYRTWGNLERSLPHLGLFGVGLGSGIFHASLREWPQICEADAFRLTSCVQYLLSGYAHIELLQAYCDVVQTADSLSMIFATAFVMHRLLTFKQSLKQSTTTTAGLIVAVIGFSVLHCKLNNMNLHSATFASMILFIAYRSSALTKQIKSPAHRKSAARLARQGARMIELVCR